MKHHDGDPGRTSDPEQSDRSHGEQYPGPDDLEADDAYGKDSKAAPETSEPPPSTGKDEPGP